MLRNIKVQKEGIEGLRDLDGFYLLNKIEGYLLRVGGWNTGFIWKFENGKCLEQLLLRNMIQS